MNFALYTPDNVGKLLALLNRVRLNNFSLVFPDGHIIGHLTVYPGGSFPNDSGKIELWGGDQPLGIEADTLDEMRLFLQGIYHAYFEGNPKERVDDYLNYLNRNRVEDHHELVEAMAKWQLT